MEDAGAPKSRSELISLRRLVEDLERKSCPCSKVGKSYGGPLKIAQEVHEAFALGRPVVALESTIIAHGMPFPQISKLQRRLKRLGGRMGLFRPATGRENWAIPATIAILDGIPCVGLHDEQLERLAKLGSKAWKVSCSDTKVAIRAHVNGATTVSAAMFYASKVGISVFVTGGIGGVHRHGEQTMDISSDHTELGRTPVAVFSAGVKSILDIPRTLEYLSDLTELGRTPVAVISAGVKSILDIPRTLDYLVRYRLDSPMECAECIRKKNVKREKKVQTHMSLRGGVENSYI